ncbi:ABC transporter ATP-binding protein [Caldibacillus thermolactis]|jgi:ABC-2 type transport system ATP-binding protein|uniref:ABC transporter ATP-binding protein n=1 Tax=Pallidibacillus thermolactis TaxID=251051 RepID=A0ABT2WDP8_9BACI|nr:ABC transporter ATP-binding protein [Pallidibacillus thermolactis]MCU9593790.1 ABC transporter ATP-binding protein [Pallidibacillus thermolactis]MED1673989.1 ABC transporter ATP-binding protein [Pallidibacillus thermolactis subsp. kokeshiiformis]
MTVQLNNVTKKYGQEFALKNVSFTFTKGKIYGLLGPNGSGKSTTLKLITGLIYPTKGTVKVKEEKVTRKVCQNVAYLTELDHFYHSFTIKQIIDFYHSQFSDFRLEKAKQLLQDMQLDERKKIRKLSKGNRGRLKLVLTLARNAPVILLDEPFSGLDALVRDSIVKSLLTYINFEEQIVIIATHEIDEIEPLLDEVIAVYQGHYIDHQNVEKLREEQGISILQWFKSTIKNWESENLETNH